MLTSAIFIFVIAAAFGLMLITRVFRGTPRPMGIIIGHGIFAATGLMLVLIYVIQNAEKSPMLSLIIFGVAALGGFLMLFIDISGKTIPKGVAIIHALAAVTGLILLVLFVMGM
jgi:hypothetical protein